MALNPEAGLADVEYEDLCASQNRGEGPIGEETPACQSCRRKKSKCSRQQPCSQCVKSGVECTYEDKRLKGGIKTGVVERLNHRIDALESMFLGQGILLQQFMQETRDGCASSLGLPQRPDEGERLTSLRSYTDKLKQTLSSLAANAEVETNEPAGSGAPATKRKVDFKPFIPSKRRLPVSAPTDDLCSISPLPMEIDDVLVTYFKLVHPWVPVLHPATFVKRARDPKRSEGVNMILSAIVAVAANYVPKMNAEGGGNLNEYAETCRQRVMSAAIEANSIEVLQALLLIAFDTISGGKSPSPWSLVSLITRKVADLQLNIEQPNIEDVRPKDDSCAEYFITTSPALRPATTWLENEERRRVFWLSFLMDRFCSIATCTSPIIASKGIHRRLPCDGCMWESNQAVETSYFSVDDQPQNEANAPEEPSPFPPPYMTNEGLNGVGGLAYTIEATELLSMITKFNLRHSLEPENTNELSTWLNRFRQLDSKLLLWELCLTHRWRDVRVINGYIDPNLTLAHMTHNAAIIVLHRRLAHPPSQSRVWLSGLVSAASREACVMAAMKIDKISRRYLAVSDGIAPHQFAFCLFVAGQALLAQASYHAVRPPDEVSSIISSLNEVSRRLTPNLPDSYTCPETPAGKLARVLAEQRDRDIPSDKGEVTRSKSQQPTPLPDFHHIPNAGNIQGVLQHCATSPSSGISPDSFIPFGQDENFMGLGQSLLPGTRIGAWPLSTSEVGRQPGCDGNDMVVGSGGRDFDFIADFRRLESRAKEP